MILTFRPYQTEDDYWRGRELLRQAMLFNHLRELSWHVARLDYWWWFANADLERIPPEEQVFIWETKGGEIAALLNPEGRGQAFLQVHPAFRTPELDEQMIAVAEQHLAFTGDDGQKKLQLYLDSQDRARQQILIRRGYSRVDHPGVQEIQHRRALDAPVDDVPGIPGYTIRSLGDGLELLERCYASGLGFHDDDTLVARDNRDHPTWYRHIQTAPLYRRDLDLIAAAPDGSIASFCTAWFDDVTRTAYFEPVATVPAHRRRGLSRALLLEGLRRLKRMGCKVAFVGGYSHQANKLYFSVMGDVHDISQPWEKVI